MTRKIKRYKPIKFGDGPDPDTVEGHRNKKIEAAETLAFLPDISSGRFEGVQRNGAAFPSLRLAVAYD